MSSIFLTLLFFGLLVITLSAISIFIFAYIPKTLRSYRIKKIAKYFDLEFDNNMNKFVENFGSYKRNIVKGNLRGHSIEVYDYYEGNVSLSNSYNRSVVVIKDGQKIKYRGAFGIIPSVGKIKRILTSIKNSQES